AARDGLHLLQDGRDTVELPGQNVTFVAPGGDGDLSAIVDGSEIWSRTGGEWQRLATIEKLRATALALTDRWLIGTSEAHLLELIDDGLTRNDAFDRVEGRDNWYTP